MIDKFTFHYVSISTSCLIHTVLYFCNLHSTMYLFQQVGYIRCNERYRNLHSTMYLFQLYSMTAVCIFHSHLHSTMYLFQRAFLSFYSYFPIHLHSTMYLFQLSPLILKLGLMKFTFHYVSISTLSTAKSTFY